MTKICTKCGTEKALDAFYRRRSSGTCGFASQCKRCCAARQKRFRAASHEAISAAAREYRCSEEVKRRTADRQRAYTDTAKICTKCGAEKPLEEFRPSKFGVGGKRGNCKACDKKYRDDNKDKAKAYRENNIDRLRAYQHKHYKKNEQKIKATALKYKEDNKKEILAYRNSALRMRRSTERQQAYTATTKICPVCGGEKLLEDYLDSPYTRSGKSQKCKECQRKVVRKDRIEHPEKYKRWRDDHKEEHKQSVLRWQEKNPEKLNEYSRRRRAMKASVDEAFTAEMAIFTKLSWGNKCAVCGKPRQEESRELAIDHWLPLSKGHALTVGNAVLMCQACNSKKSFHSVMNIYDTATIRRIEAKLQEQVDAWRELLLEAVA